jgi:hypothetical protein
MENTVKVTLDPWEHRAVRMRCISCMWFVVKGTGNVGRCRRHSPSMSGSI